MEQNHKEHPAGCMCMMCRGGKHGLLRWVVKIVILLVVFWFGVKVGEFKVLFGGGAGHYGMMRGAYGTSYYGMPMMWGWGNAALPQSSTTAPYYGPGGMMRYFYENAAPQATPSK